MSRQFRRMSGQCHQTVRSAPFRRDGTDRNTLLRDLPLLDGYTTSRQEGSAMPPTMTYGQPPRWADVYARVVATGTDLRRQLEALVQATYGDVDADRLGRMTTRSV